MACSFGSAGTAYVSAWTEKQEHHSKRTGYAISQNGVTRLLAQVSLAVGGRNEEEGCLQSSGKGGRGVSGAGGARAGVVFNVVAGRGQRQAVSVRCSWSRESLGVQGGAASLLPET